MAYTQSDLDAIRSAIARGARRVKMNNEEVEFRDLAEMRQIEAIIAREISGASTSKLVYPQTRTGWRS